MRLTRWVGLAVAATVGFANVAAAQLTENFDATFPAWESGWFGQNSDAYNYYCDRPCAQRGNNPTGLWLGGSAGVNQTSPILVTFNSAFGASLTSLSMDVASFVPTSFNVWDANGALIFSQALTQVGATTPVTAYNNLVSVTSTTGIGAFGFDASNAAGNTAVDNITVNGGRVTATPEPATVALMATGLVAVAGVARRRRGTV